MATFTLKRPSTRSGPVRRPGTANWLILGLAVISAPLVGLIAAFGVVPALVLASLVCGAAVLALPLLSLWVLSVGALCVAGLVELYLPAFQHIRWLFVALAVLLAAASLIGHAARPTLGADRRRPIIAGSSLITLAALFFAVSAAASLLGGGGVLAALVGLKGYFQVWGLWIALCWSTVGFPKVARIFGALLPIALVQLPVALHQYLVLVPLRRGYEATTKGLVAIDVVSGTFGGALLGGGRSAALAILAMVGLALAIGRYRGGRTRSLWRTWLTIGLCLAPLAISEVKVVFVLLPLTLWLLFGGLVLRRPLAFVAGALATLAALAGALVLYSSMIVVKGGSGNPVTNYLYESAGYNVGAGGYGNAGLNRKTVYTFWYDRNLGQGDVVHALIGHGPSAVNVASTAASDSLAATQFAGYFPGLTGLSTLLWEVGLVGSALFVALLTVAYRAAGRLARNAELAPWKAELEAGRVLFAMLGVSLLHNNLLMIDLATQTLMALGLGLILAARRQLATGSGAAGALRTGAA